MANSDLVAVALDLTSDPGLEAEGLAREFVSRVQRLRRQQQLEVTDRIELDWWTDNRSLIEAVNAHRDHVMAELLATDLRVVDDLADHEVDPLEGSALRVRIRPGGQIAG